MASLPVGPHRTGQFTQQDPIGLAGGLNLYGFANGDPVNFSDPFGLRVACPSCTTMVSAAIEDALTPGSGELESTWFDPVALASGFVGGLRSLGVRALSGLFGREVAQGATGIATKAAARQVASGLRLGEAQLGAVNSAIGRATSTSTIDVVQGRAGAVMVRISRPGRNGYQVIESTVARDGSKTVIQKAYDAAGDLVHYDPKNF